MKSLSYCITIVFLLSTSFSVSSSSSNYNDAFALMLAPKFIFETAESRYHDTNDVVRLFGTIKSGIVNPDTKYVLIEVFGPDGTLYRSENVTLNIQKYSDVKFTDAFTFDDSSLPGDYQIIATYDTIESVQIITYRGDEHDANNYKIFMTRINDKNYPIEYKLSKESKITGMHVSSNSNKVNIGVEPADVQGQILQIKLPRELIDSLAEGNNGFDLPFKVFMGAAGANIGQTDSFKEIENNESYRVLEFNLTKNNQSIIVIQGTFVNPNVQTKNTLNDIPIASPYEQLRKGVGLQNIQCKQNLVLIQKYDGTPACVTEPTKTKLVDRGWTAKDSSAQKIIDEITTPKYGTAEFDTEYHKARQIYLDVRKPMDLPFIGLTIDSTEKHVVLGINSDKLTAEKDKTYYRQLVDELFKDVNLNIMIHYKNTTGLIFDE